MSSEPGDITGFLYEIGEAEAGDLKNFLECHAKFLGHIVTCAPLHRADHALWRMPSNRENERETVARSVRCVKCIQLFELSRGAVRQSGAPLFAA